MLERRAEPSVRIGAWLDEGWQLFTKEWGTWVLMMVVLVALTIVASIPGAVISALLNIGRDPADGPNPLGFGVSFGFNILNWILYAFLFGGLFRTAFKQLRGEPISVADLFSGKDVFGRIIGAQLVLWLIAMVLVLFLVPFFFALRSGHVNLVFVFAIVLGYLLLLTIVNNLFYFTIPLIVERSAGVFEAVRESATRTKDHLLMFFALAIVFFVLVIVGLIPCGLGLLAVGPLYFLVVAVAYRDFFGLAGAHQIPPVAAPPAYAPQAYNQQSWANQPPQSYAPPPPAQPPQSYAPQRPYAPPPITPQAPAQPSQPTTTVCPHCQAVLPRAANFCNFCGKPLQG